MWKTAFKKLEGKWPLNFFKGCLPQILLGPFLNTFFQIWLHYDTTLNNKVDTTFIFVHTVPFFWALIMTSHFGPNPKNTEIKQNLDLNIYPSIYLKLELKLSFSKDLQRKILNTFMTIWICWNNCSNLFDFSYLVG